MAYSYWFYDASGKSIRVDKGSPATGKYVIFYAIKKQSDPMIFCKSYEVARKEVKKLYKRDDVQHKSIRLFKLVSIVK